MNNINQQIERIKTGIELEIIEPENILILSPSAYRLENMRLENLENTRRFINLNRGLDK